MTTWLIAALCLAAAPEDGPAASGWHYVLPDPGDPFEHPPPRALGLARTPPEDVAEAASYRGTRRRYGQLRFGSPGSTRVTVVLDEGGPDGPALYVDASRDRRVDDGDLVPGAGRTWRVSLPAEVAEDGATLHEPRAVVFRLGATGLTLSYAAAGYLEGVARLGDREVLARRTDGDGNGLLADAQDRLWLDLDGDGRLDPRAEQFLYAPILTLGGDRFALRADAVGDRLALESLEGTGTLRLALDHPAGSAEVISVAATLVGRDGSAVGLDGVDATATVPVGAYRLGTVTLTLADPAGGPNWSYVFSDQGRRGPATWHEVAPDAEVLVDPIGMPELTTSLEERTEAARPGEILAIQPGLYTGDGLLIVTCYRGAPSLVAGHDGPGAEIVLETTGGRPLSSAHSGFA